MESHASESWKLTQVGVVVKDVNKVVDRLVSLGIGPFQPKTLPPGRQEWYRGKPMDAKMNIQAAMLGGVELELIEPVEGASPHREFLDGKGEGIQHMMFAVDDLGKELENLTGKGCTILLKANMPGGRQLAYVDLEAGGIIVELVEKKR